MQDLDFGTPAKFTLATKGETTEQTYSGLFKFKRMLNHFDQLVEDKTYRELLGGVAPERAPAELEKVARVIAGLTVRVVEAPQWWALTDHGRHVADTNVLVDVYNAAIKAESDFQDDLAKRREAAKKTLEATKPEKAGD